MDKVYQPNLRELLKKCYQCARCTGVCQISKVQYFRPSRIIQQILEGFEEKVLESGVLWDCLMCNSCLQNCPEEINFADIVRNAKYLMVHKYGQNPEECLAHKGIYTSIAELMSKLEVKPSRDLSWVPKDCEVGEEGNILYHVGCTPFFKFEFDELNTVPVSTLRILSQIEDEPIVVLKDEYCCGHDLYWGQGKMEEFITLAKKNIENFESAGISTIITTCAEGYRTFKIDYPKIFDDFSQKFEVKHIIEYVYEQWKAGKIQLRLDEELTEQIEFTFHDPCRMSRFLPKSNTIMKKVREIFLQLERLGYKFTEMEHNQEDALCCGVSCWMNCNERSKALRYKRLMEAKKAGDTMVTSCPKCILHFNCLQEDYKEFSALKVLDFTEFIINLVEIQKNNDNNKEEK
jgi:Fe-S oxidoreductase